MHNFLTKFLWHEEKKSKISKTDKYACCLHKSTDHFPNTFDPILIRYVFWCDKLFRLQRFGMLVWSDLKLKLTWKCKFDNYASLNQQRLSKLSKHEKTARKSQNQTWKFTGVEQKFKYRRGILLINLAYFPN